MAQLIDLGKLRFHFAGEWANGTTYERNDIVKYGGNVYVYTHTLKTSGNVPTDTAYWALMVEGFKFEGVFDTTTTYQVGDAVSHGGKVYVSVLGSTGQTPPNTTYWSQFVDGIQYEGVYSNTAAYQKNDMVTYGGSVYMAKQDTTGNLPTVTTYWDQFVEGISPEGVYNNSTAYVPGDLVAYGPNLYRAIANTTGNLPTDTANWETYVAGTKFQGAYDNATQYYLNDIVLYGANAYRAKNDVSATLPPSSTSDWELVIEGFSHQGNWSSSTAYLINQVVTYGGSLYKALRDNNAQNPSTQTSDWIRLNGGINNRATWATTTDYDTDDVVSYGGNTFIALEPHASGSFAADLAANKWQKFSSGVDYKGGWATGSYYKVDDIIKDGISSYICLVDHQAATFATDVAAAKWEFFARGATDVLPVVTASDTGSSLTVAADGINYAWIGATNSNNVYYVAPHGTDTVESGKAMATPFASIKYACATAPTNSVIYVKNGTYEEQLPIVVKDTQAIIGDSQRSVIVQPETTADNGFGAGISDDGTTPNNQSQMFQLSNGSILKGMSFNGMTGWTAAASPNQDNIASSTAKGICVALNPNSPVTSKSPYVMECSAIGSGCIGAYVNGSAHSSGNKSMLFHAYTVIADNGVGFWIANGAKAEVVSCFTYYCYFGYAADHGAQIRALNGNNSYGTWGAVSVGFDQNETALTGAVKGSRLHVDNFQVASFQVGETITGGTSSATAVVTNVQQSAGYVYVKDVTGTFQVNEQVTGGTSSGTADVDSNAIQDQRGFVIVADGFASTPEPGRSIQFAGDTIAYVIQSVSGTYADATSEMTLVLAQEKTTGSADNVAITIRKGFSQIRLTGHDFLSIGTGGFTTTNYPGTPTQAAAQGNEVQENFPARVYYISTDQDGNFRVGEYFRIEQATGKATLNASAFDLAGLTSLRLGSIGAQLGEQINEFSSDASLSGSSNTAVPTENAVKIYADTKVAKSGDTMSGVLAMGANKITGLAAPTDANDATNKTYADTKVTKAGDSMSGDLAMGSNKVTGLSAPTDANDATTKTYVDTEIVAGAQNQTVTIVSGNTTLTLGQVFAVDGAHTVTLPASATAGDTIKIIDVSGAASTANITVARNSNNIAGSANDLTIDVNNAGVELVYINSTYGWGVL